VNPGCSWSQHPRSRFGAAVSQPLVNDQGTAAILTVTPTTGPSDRATEQLVRRRRDDTIPQATRAAAVLEKGWGVSVVGLSSEIAIVSFVPLMMFTILFGLSMDYEVFLMTHRERTGDNRRAVIEGVAHAGRSSRRRR
jgi:hypothetical protein